MIEELLGQEVSGLLIDREVFDKSMEVMDTPFHRWCYSAGIGREHLTKWGVGGARIKTHFYYQDNEGQVINRHEMSFSEKGKPMKNTYFMKKPKDQDQAYDHCLYGQHLYNPMNDICLVRTELEAVVASYFDNTKKYNWMACGDSLKDSQLKFLANKSVILVRSGVAKSTYNMEKKLAKHMVSYRICKLWEEEENVFKTIADIYLDGKNPEIGNNLITPELDLNDSFFDGLTDEQASCYLNYQFYENEKAYYVRSGEEGKKAVSNFTLEPIAFVLSEENYRLFRIHGQIHFDGKKSIKIDKGTLTSINGFKTEMDDIGPYIFWGNQSNLDKIKMKWFKELPIAKAIEYLGWHADGFYAFSNGIVTKDGAFMPVDNEGLVQLGEVNYFIPSMSEALKVEENTDSEDMYENDRIMVYKDEAGMDFENWGRRFCEVFGENGQVMVCFIIATIYRDYIMKSQRMQLPLLFSYGRPMSGKSQMTMAARQMFFTDTDPVNLKSASDAAFYKAASMFNNTLTHLEEFRTDIDAHKIDGLKNMYDGTSRTVSKMTRKAKTSTLKVRSGISITGERLPTDNGLHTRILTLVFDKVDFSEQEMERFKLFVSDCGKGISNVIAELVSVREQFEQTFKMAYKNASKKLDKVMIGSGEKQGRVSNSFSLLLAVASCMQNIVKLPFDYSDFEKTMISKMNEQLGMLSETSDTGEFWSFVSSLLNLKVLKSGHDVLVMKHLKSLAIIGEVKDKKGGLIKRDFKPSKDVALVRFTSLYNIFAKEYRQVKGESAMEKRVLQDYLKNDDSFIGVAKSAQFLTIRTSCYLFDADMLKERGIDLDFELVDPNEGSEGGDMELEEKKAMIRKREEEAKKIDL